MVKDITKQRNTSSNHLIKTFSHPMKFNGIPVALQKLVIKGGNKLNNNIHIITKLVIPAVIENIIPNNFLSIIYFPFNYYQSNYFSDN